MGWAYCGKDREGREIGYGIEAICDHPDCNAKIDRGLAYSCGGMHGEKEYYCDKYFCPKHLFYMDEVDVVHPICKECSTLYIEKNYDSTNRIKVNPKKRKK